MHHRYATSFVPNQKPAISVRTLVNFSLGHSGCANLNITVIRIQICEILRTSEPQVTSLVNPLRG